MNPINISTIIGYRRRVKWLLLRFAIVLAMGFIFTSGYWQLAFSAPIILSPEIDSLGVKNDNNGDADPDTSNKTVSENTIANVAAGSLTIVKEATPKDGTDFAFTAGGPGFPSTTPPSFLLKWGSFGSGDGQFDTPFGVAIDGSGHIYVADTSNHRIQKFDSFGNFLLKWGSGGIGNGQFSLPGSMAMDGNGHVYVVDASNHRIQKFDSSGNFLLKWGSRGRGDGQFTNPFGVAVDGNDYVYVADTANYRIQKFDSSGNFLLKWGSRGRGDGQFSQPGGMAVDGNGYVYVIDIDYDRIQKFDSSGTFLLKWGSEGSSDGQFSFPIGVAVDSKNHVYVADTGNNRIQKFDSSGTFLLKWGNEDSSGSQLTSPVGVAVDGSGQIYVVNSSIDLIQKFGPTGGNVVAFSLDDETTQTDSISQTITFNDLIAGTYTITETLPVDWQLDNATCTGGSDPGSLNGETLSVALEAGEDVTCTFTNSLPTSSLTIVKEATPEDGTDFDFTAIGPGFPSTNPPPFLLKWGSKGSGDGQFDKPSGVAVDGNGHIFVVDQYNDRIQKFDSSGIYLTQWGSRGNGDGQLSSPGSMVIDGNGHVYVVDTGNHRIQKFDSSGSFLLKWGGLGNGNGQFEIPVGLAVDDSGHVYVADQNNHRIQKFDSSGNYLTQWGNFGSSDGQLSYPTGVAVDGDDHVYVADAGNRRIQKFDSLGSFLLKWGSEGSGEGQFSFQFNVTVDDSSHVYVADRLNDQVQMFDSSGNFLLKWGSRGSKEDQLFSPLDVAVDSHSYIYVADTGHNRIQKFGPAGGNRMIFSLDDEAPQTDTVSQTITFDELTSGTYIITETLPIDWQLDSATCTGGNDPGSLDGETLSVILQAGEDMTCIFTNSLQTGSLTIIKAATPADGTDFEFRGNIPLGRFGTISTVAGDGSPSYGGDGGPATLAQLSHPYGVAVDSEANLFIADTFNNRIRQVTASTGLISTVAGDGSYGHSYGGDGGPAILAQLSHPNRVTIDDDGNFFIATANKYNHHIQQVTAGTGIISTVAGKRGFYHGGYSGDGGPATNARLSYPHGVAIDGNGNLFIADTVNDRIRQVTADTGIISTVAGGNGYGYGGDGNLAIQAQLNSPFGVAVDSDGNIFIADTGNRRIRQVAAGTGIISTVAGDGTEGYSGDGDLATRAQLNAPVGVAVDNDGNLFIADINNHHIRQVASDTGVISTVAGDGTKGYSGDSGLAAIAQLNSPTGVAVDSDGNLFIADKDNHRIRQVTASFNLDDAVPDDGDEVKQQIIFDNLSAKTYNITEILPVGWQLDSATCTGGSDPGSLTDETLSVALGVGEDVVCTFTNSFNPVPTMINALLELDSSQVDYDPTPAPNALHGTITITASFRNISTTTVSDMHFEVVDLTNSNLLLNADSGPAGPRAIISVSPETLGANEILDTNESFTIAFQIGLASTQRFSLVVDSYSLILEEAAQASASGNNSFRFEIDPGKLLANDNNQYYIPIIMK